MLDVNLGGLGGGHTSLFWLLLMVVAAGAGVLIAWGAGRLRRRHRDRMLRRRMAALARDMQARRPDPADLR